MHQFLESTSPVTSIGEGLKARIGSFDIKNLTGKGIWPILCQCYGSIQLLRSKVETLKTLQVVKIVVPLILFMSVT